MNNFFTRLEPLLTKADLNMTISAKEGQITVSVLPKGELKDENNHIIPLVIRGTAEELDKEFLEAIFKPIEKAAGLFCNTEDFNKSVEETDQAIKEEQEKKPAAKKSTAKKVDDKAATIDKAKEEVAKREAAELKKKEEQEKKERKKNCEILTKHAEQLFKDSKLKFAIGCLNEAREFADDKTAIDNRLEEIMKIISNMGFYDEKGLEEVRNFQSSYKTELLKIEATSTQENDAPGDQVKENPVVDESFVDENSKDEEFKDTRDETATQDSNNAEKGEQK